MPEPSDTLQAHVEAGRIHSLKPTGTNGARVALLERIENDFTYHAPTPEQQVAYVQLRQQGLEFARLVANMTPVSKEQSHAINHIRQAIMWANAAIACNPSEA